MEDVNTPADLRKVFQFFDKNGDGTISAGELATVIRGMGNNPTREELESIMEEIDLNDDGSIDFGEFEKLMTMEAIQGRGSYSGAAGATDPREIVESFRIFDYSRSGLIEVSEFRRVMSTLGEKLPAKMVDEMIKICDVNDDGFIDYEKFVNAVVSTPGSIPVFS